MVAAIGTGTWTALNGDVVGYSRLVADDVERTSAALEAYREIVYRGVQGASGVVANFVGDNFMAVFPDTRSAMQTAIAITTTIEERNHGLPAHQKVRFRMGLDLGPITESEGNHHGEALNVAARIQAMAPAGGISVSGAVYRELDEPALRFQPRGVHRLKNILEPVEVYDFADLPADGDRDVTPSVLSLEPPTVAVLPIHTEGVDPSLLPLAEVIRTDLLHGLGSIPDLHVMDAQMAVDARAEGRARYLLESGLHQFGDNVQVYGVVFDVTTMNVVTSHKHVVPTAEVMAASDRLAAGLARDLEVELIVGAPAGLYAELDDPASIQMIYQGWYHLRSGTRNGWEQALALFLRVADTHPAHMYGKALAAYALWSGVDNGWADPAPTLTRAEDLAREADATGDPTGMAKAVIAAIRMTQGQSGEALELLADLEIQRPTCDVTYALEGSVKRYLGEWEEAVDLMDVAMRLTGINKPWYPTVKACSFFIGQRLELAAAMAESVIEHQPGNVEALLVLAAAQVELGLTRRAQATAALVRAEVPTLDVDRWLDRSPYADPAIVDRWRADLAVLGLVTP